MLVVVAFGVAANAICCRAISTRPTVNQKTVAACRTSDTLRGVILKGALAAAVLPKVVVAQATLVPTSDACQGFRSITNVVDVENCIQIDGDVEVNSWDFTDTNSFIFNDRLPNLEEINGQLTVTRASDVETFKINPGSVNIHNGIVFEKNCAEPRVEPDGICLGNADISDVTDPYNHCEFITGDAVVSAEFYGNGIDFSSLFPDLQRIGGDIHVQEAPENFEVLLGDLILDGAIVINMKSDECATTNAPTPNPTEAQCRCRNDALQCYIANQNGNLKWRRVSECPPGFACPLCTVEDCRCRSSNNRLQCFLSTFTIEKDDTVSARGSWTNVDDCPVNEDVIRESCPECISGTSFLQSAKKKQNTNNGTTLAGKKYRHASRAMAAGLVAAAIAPAQVVAQDSSTPVICDETCEGNCQLTDISKILDCSEITGDVSISSWDFVDTNSFHFDERLPNLTEIDGQVRVIRAVDDFQVSPGDVDVVNGFVFDQNCNEPNDPPAGVCHGDFEFDMATGEVEPECELITGDVIVSAAQESSFNLSASFPNLQQVAGDVRIKNATDSFRFINNGVQLDGGIVIGGEGECDGFGIPSIRPSAAPTSVPTEDPTPAPSSSPTDDGSEQTGQPTMMPTDAQCRCRNDALQCNIANRNGNLKYRRVSHCPPGYACPLCQVVDCRCNSDRLQCFESRFEEGDEIFTRSSWVNVDVCPDNPDVDRVSCPVCGVQQTENPTLSPTSSPIVNPTEDPTPEPSAKPTLHPIANPTAQPSVRPTSNPVENPTSTPTTPSGLDCECHPRDPERIRCQVPKEDGTFKRRTTRGENCPGGNLFRDFPDTICPVCTESEAPTVAPVANPTSEPSEAPSSSPIVAPTLDPVSSPTVESTGHPTSSPFVVTTADPTSNPTNNPSSIPSAGPSVQPTMEPSHSPTDRPSTSPTETRALECICKPGNVEKIKCQVPQGDGTFKTNTVKLSNCPDGSLFDNFPDTVCPVCTAAPSLVPSASPSLTPSASPSAEPTSDPTPSPIGQPTVDPSARPSIAPTSVPSVRPSADPTSDPTGTPFADPTSDPTARPSVQPTSLPTARPTGDPSVGPTVAPSVDPTLRPSVQPTVVPSAEPIIVPSIMPSFQPTNVPTGTPFADPTFDPTGKPSAEPTVAPSVTSTGDPTFVPSASPSVNPTQFPTAPRALDCICKPGNVEKIKCQVPQDDGTFKTNTIKSSNCPDGSLFQDFPDTICPVCTAAPSLAPSTSPSVRPTANPSGEPTPDPTPSPIGEPTSDPSARPSAAPTGDPTHQPSSDPSAMPTMVPTTDPTAEPTTGHPTSVPSALPTAEPTARPSSNPTQFPTAPRALDCICKPGNVEKIKCQVPQEDGTFKTNTIKSSNCPDGSLFQDFPDTVCPVCTAAPSVVPSASPSVRPTAGPSREPTPDPTSSPTGQPTSDPSAGPSVVPTGDPTHQPSADPSAMPTTVPTTDPTAEPTTADPTLAPTALPSAAPTGVPTGRCNNYDSSAFTYDPSTGILDGDLIITSDCNGAFATDFDELSDLVEITGDLNIVSASGLTMVEVPEVIESITVGSITITSNPLLQVLDLSGIGQVRGQVRIAFNDRLRFVSLNAVSTIGGITFFNRLPMLTELKLNWLRSVGSNLDVRDLDKLIIFEAPRLTHVGGLLDLSENDLLVGADFSSLLTVLLFLKISENGDGVADPSEFQLDLGLYQAQGSGCVRDFFLDDRSDGNGVGFNICGDDQCGDASSIGTFFENGDIRVCNLVVVEDELLYRASTPSINCCFTDAPSITPTGTPTPEPTAAPTAACFLDDGWNPETGIITGDLATGPHCEGALDLEDFYPGLVEVTGSITVSTNFGFLPGLISLSIPGRNNAETGQFEGIKVGGEVVIAANDLLELLNLDGITSIGTDVDIQRNDALSTVFAENLVSVGGSVSFEENPALEQTSFSRLHTVHGDITVTATGGSSLVRLSLGLYDGGCVGGDFNTEIEDFRVFLVCPLDLNECEPHGNVDDRASGGDFEVCGSVITDGQVTYANSDNSCTCVTGSPSLAPTPLPTLAPTPPTPSPTGHPSLIPSAHPTAAPTPAPSVAPTIKALDCICKPGNVQKIKCQVPQNDGTFETTTVRLDKCPNEGIFVDYPDTVCPVCTAVPSLVPTAAPTETWCHDILDVLMSSGDFVWDPATGILDGDLIIPPNSCQGTFNADLAFPGLVEITGTLEIPAEFGGGDHQLTSFIMRGSGNADGIRIRGKGVEAWGVIVSGSDALTLLDLSGVKRARNFWINGNDVLATVDLSSLVTVDEHFGFNDNDMLQTVSISSLKTIGPIADPSCAGGWEFSLDFLRNRQLQTFSAESLEMIAGGIWFETNTMLSTVSLPVLNTVTYDIYFKMQAPGEVTLFLGFVQDQGTGCIQGDFDGFVYSAVDLICGGGPVDTRRCISGHDSTETFGTLAENGDLTLCGVVEEDGEVVYENFGSCSCPTTVTVDPALHPHWTHDCEPFDITPRPTGMPTPPTTSPTPAPTESPLCSCGRSEFDAGFGGCFDYDPNAFPSNFGQCDFDCEFDFELGQPGLCAWQVCWECGRCRERHSECFDCPDFSNC